MKITNDLNNNSDFLSMSNKGEENTSLLGSLFSININSNEVKSNSISDDFEFVFRKEDINTPVIMLTANSQLNIKTQSYNLGCDDYLIKPFEPIELILRIKKLLDPRINNIRVDKKYYFGDFIYESNTKKLNKNNKTVKLTTNEEYLLEILIKNINKEISREYIGKILNIDSNLRSVDVIVARLRKKITSNSDSSFLKTVRGKGYMLISEYE